MSKKTASTAIAAFVLFLCMTNLAVVSVAEDKEKSKKKQVVTLEDDRGIYSEEVDVCGPTEDTPELHKARCEHKPECKCIADGKWCFKETNLSVSVSSDKYKFSGPSRVECVQDNQGSCEWNALGAPDRFFIKLQNPDKIQATILTNSRAIKVRLCAKARFYP